MRGAAALDGNEKWLNAVFACGTAVEEAVRVTPPLVYNGRRREDATVTDIRAAVDRSVSIVGS